MSATELVCAAPSQQRLRRSSDSVAAPSQLRRSSAARSISSVAAASARRDAQNERDGDGLRISVAAATSSQLRRCAHHERSTGHRAEQPLGKIWHFWAKTGVHSPPPRRHKPCEFELFSLKSLGHSPAPEFFFGVKKSGVWVVTHRICGFFQAGQTAAARCSVCERERGAGGAIGWCVGKREGVSLRAAQSPTRASARRASPASRSTSSSASNMLAEQG